MEENSRSFLNSHTISIFNLYSPFMLFSLFSLRTGARFSVRVSAVEVVGKSENLKDLLGEQGNGSMCSSGGTSPSVYLPRERASSIQVRRLKGFKETVIVLYSTGYFIPHPILCL